MHTIWVKKVRFKRTKESGESCFIRVGCYRPGGAQYNTGYITIIELRLYNVITMYRRQASINLWKDYLIK